MKFGRKSKTEAPDVAETDEASGESVEESDAAEEDAAVDTTGGPAEVVECDPGPAGAELATGHRDPGGAVRQEQRGDQGAGDERHHPGGQGRQGDRHGQPQAGHQHRPLHPPAQGDGQSLGVLHGDKPVTSRTKGRR